MQSNSTTRSSSSQQSRSSLRQTIPTASLQLSLVLEFRRLEENLYKKLILLILEGSRLSNRNEHRQQKSSSSMKTNCEIIEILINSICINICIEF